MEPEPLAVMLPVDLDAMAGELAGERVSQAIDVRVADREARTDLAIELASGVGALDAGALGGEAHGDAQGERHDAQAAHGGADTRNKRRSGPFTSSEPCVPHRCARARHRGSGASFPPCTLVV